MKCRGRGDGSIYYRESDNRYVSSIVLPNDKRKYYYGQTRKEVQIKLKKAQLELEQGTLVTAHDQPFKKFIESWLAIKRATWKEGTYVSYESYMRRQVLPHIGRVKLQKIATDTIQQLYSTLQQEGLSANTIRLIHTILNIAFRDAIAWKYISTNPCTAAKPPRKDDHEMQVLSLEQGQRLIETARHTPLACMISLALATGMRKGEILGLQWNDIDMEQATLHVKRTVSYLPGSSGKHEYQVSEPKTASSRRSIMLPQFVIEALKRHRADQLKTRLKTGEKWQDQGRVFCTQRGGYYPLHVLFQQFKRLLHATGLPDMRFHDLRHSAATILLSMGVHIKVVQELLGHSNVSITLNIYAHVLPNLQREAMSSLDEKFRQSL